MFIVGVIVVVAEFCVGVVDRIAGESLFMFVGVYIGPPGLEAFAIASPFISPLLCRSYLGRKVYYTCARPLLSRLHTLQLGNVPYCGEDVVRDIVAVIHSRRVEGATIAYRLSFYSKPA